MLAFFDSNVSGSHGLDFGSGFDQGILPGELARATAEEKDAQIANLRAFQAAHSGEAGAALTRLQEVAAAGGNIFAELMQTVRCASLGEITRALYQVGGQYRRNM